MTQTKKSPFIEGFKQPTLPKNNLITLADIRGDGEGKLIIWSDQQNQLIVYKGSNRQLQKSSNIKNASGIISYLDENRAAIGISAQNCFYIFRSMNESYRLKIPDIFAQQQEQILWSQYESQPGKLSEQLAKIPKKLLSETARHFISAATEQRKLQFIKKVFTEGINEKDSISAMSNLKKNKGSIGNIVLGTQLNRLYILDIYGHAIVEERVIDSVPIILLAHGQYLKDFMIIAIDRQGVISFHLNKNSKSYAEYQNQKLKLSSRVITADLLYPELIVCTQDQVVLIFQLSNWLEQFQIQILRFKLPKQPIKVLIIEHKSIKLSLILFQDQFRLYCNKQVIYSHFTPHKMYDILFGSFAKQENCLILMYENQGFEVLILHRQFNPKQTYGSNKQITDKAQDIPIPKKSIQFKVYWDQNKDEAQSYKIYERSLKLLKWRTYRQKFSEKSESQAHLKINSKILGLGPDFVIKLIIENSTQEPLQNVAIIPVYDKDKIKLIKMLRLLPMLSPSIPYNLDIRVFSKSFKNQSIDFQLFFGTKCFKATVYLPNCEEFADQ